MSKEPEVGDVWAENNNPKLHYHISEVSGYILYYVCNSGYGISTYSSSTERFIQECTYLGKSKANIDDLFKTENEE